MSNYAPGGPDFDEAETLRSQGLTGLVSTMVYRAYIGELYHPSVATAAFELEKREPGKWTLARNVECRPIFDKAYLDVLHLGMELTNAVAVPHVDAPIHEVLEFKNSRRSELLALRAELAETQRRIHEVDDFAAVKALEIERLDQALSDHLRVSREWKFPVTLANVKMKVSSRMITSGSSFAGATALMNLPIAASVLAGVVGGVGGMFEADVIRRPPPIQNNAFEYAARFHRNFTM